MLRTKITRLEDPSSNTKRDSAVLSGLAHQTDDLMMRRVNDGYVVDSHNFVTAEKSAIDIGGTTRYYVTNRYLKDVEFMRKMNLFICEIGFKFALQHKIVTVTI